MKKNDGVPDLIRRAPTFRDQDIQAVNGDFIAYLFRNSKTREIWTSCCGRYEVTKEKDLTAEEKAVFEAEHQAEPKGSWGKCGWQPPQKQKTIACPYCGKKAVVKELYKTGQRKNLYAWRRGVVLRWYREGLWALLYDAEKQYSREADLTSKPQMFLRGAYRFAPGRVEMVKRGWWLDGWEYAEEKKWKKKVIPSKVPNPFNACSEYGLGYDFHDNGEWAKSPFRWCDLKDFNKRHGSTLQFAVACAFWPRQVEMLQKAGLEEIVRDYVIHGKKNTYLFNWDETDPRKSFGLELRELQPYKKGYNKLERLYVYKRLKRAGWEEKPENVEWLVHEAWNHYKKVVKWVAKCKLPIGKWRKYIEKERKGRDISFAAEQWGDYMDAAEVVGLDLKNPVIHCPRDLYKKHDEITAAATPIRLERTLKKQSDKMKVRTENLTKRYEFETERWVIRAPVSAQEIVEEGKALQHCVGGCADRHINGTTTILFLRDRKKPNIPLVTIEIRGTEIQQIHGFRNEIVSCKENPKRQSPEILYADILTPWLEWVKAGSKRDKDWKPKLPKKMKKEAHVA